VSKGARLALGLLDAEIIDADDAEGDEDDRRKSLWDPASLIERSMKRLWLPDKLERFSFTYGLTTLEDTFYFVLTLDEGSYLDFSHVAEVCDRAHEQLGPSLLTHLHACTPLTPAFTPEVCRDYIVSYHWEGFEEAENLLEMARNDLAYAQGVDEDSLSDEEVESYADSHYLTPRRVDSLIARRYQQPGGLSLEACAELCRRHRFTNLSSVCVLLAELRALKAELPERSERPYEVGDGYQPFGLVVGMPGGPSEARTLEGAEMDLVEEMFHEHEQSVWQGGEFEPVYALEVDLDEPGSLNTLREALETCKRSLELTQKLCDTLEATRCLFP